MRYAFAILACLAASPAIAACETQHSYDSLYNCLENDQRIERLERQERYREEERYQQHLYDTYRDR